jgi:hypothetical protein
MTRTDLLVRAALCVAAGSAWLGCGGAGDADAGSKGGSSGDADGADGGGAMNLPGNAISGTVMGMTFTTVASSYWLDHPSAAGAPTQIYLLDEKIPCQAISAPGWDKTLASNSQLLEIDLAGSMPSTFHIPTDVEANYVGGPYNPSADGGTVTIAAVNPSQNVTGSFDIQFGSTALMGTFDASFCATGVEP